MKKFKKTIRKRILLTKNLIIYKNIIIRICFKIRIQTLYLYGYTVNILIKYYKIKNNFK